MRVGEKIAMAVLILIAIVLFTYPLIIAGMWNASAGGTSPFKMVIDKTVDLAHIKEYNSYKEKYVKEKFGGIVSTRLVAPYGHWSSFVNYAYTVSFDDIMDKQFVIYVNKKTGACHDNFYEILSTDPKFQHLYSKWVKKQVGIEDSDVELKFYGQQSDPKLEISFDSIEYLSNDYREVFENVKYLYCNGINVNNIYDLTEENSYDIAKELLDKYFDKIVELIGKPPFIFSIRIGLSNNEFLDSDLNIYYRYDYSGEKELEKTEW